MQWTLFNENFAGSWSIIFSSVVERGLNIAMSYSSIIRLLFAQKSEMKEINDIFQSNGMHTESLFN